jgi:hypothetical protein
MLDSLAEELVAGLERHGFSVLEVALERLLVKLRWRGEAVLLGAPDIVVAASTPCGGFATVNVEYATYASAPDTVRHRHALYSIALYRMYGFPVVPVLLVERPGARRSAYILRRGRGWERELESRIRRLLSIVSGKAEPRPPRGRGACVSCPPRLRGLCPLKAG